MTLTAAQRSEINERNASYSTGLKTASGRDKARRHALKHGLRADTLALPNEDPELVAERCRAWNDYYRPQSPAAQHLVNECVQATLLSERFHRFHAAALTDQIRRAPDGPAKFSDYSQYAGGRLPILTANALSRRTPPVRTGGPAGRVREGQSPGRASDHGFG
jgi:hypothetical protein